MILHRLKMCHFRQFKGEQQIEFSPKAGDKRDEDCNVTVLFGENGRGKTGIFRAVIFCLFGDRRLTQDGDVPDEEIQLVNVSALKESHGKPVETSVELEFSHGKRRYVLRRAIVAMQDKNGISEERSDLSMVEVAPSGNSRVVDPADIDSHVGAILDKRVKDYFLFDGEKIERLTRADISQRREIGKGIRNLLNIDALETARKALDKITKTLEDEVRKNASPEFARLLKARKDNEDHQSDRKTRLEGHEEEASLARVELEKVDKELAKFQEIRHLLQARESAEDSLVDLEKRAGESLAGMKSLTGKAAALIIASTISSVFDHIDAQKQKGEIPSEIRKDLIERILADKKCICGNAVCDGTDAYRLILEWLHRTSDLRVQDAALSLWRDLSDIRRHSEDDRTQIQNQLIGYGNLRNEVRSTQERLAAIHRQIGTSERQDAGKLDEHRKHIEGKLRKLEVQASILHAELQQLVRDHEKISAQIKEEEAKSHRQDELSRRATLARATQEALGCIHAEFTREVKDIIGKQATALFQQLLDQEGRETLRTIVVSDDYSLQVLDRWGKPFLANISAGQRQIMSIAFIAALAQAASRGSLLEMPLFMDTPFGRLSRDHRNNLIKLLPGLASQWILLATDTEFRRQEARLLKSGGRWGKFYMLRAVDGNTVIQEKAVGVAQTLLAEEDSSE